MVAVVSGSGLGLFGSTVGAGAAGIGQGRDRIYVTQTLHNSELPPHAASFI
jgi:hypothetical protein